ncbi:MULTISPECIES: MmgE/PrpD family protein [unclassified Massilia]|uniref:MmgE/PrpD family protein n=1 Tax=unclassified Massilia TaxID=2609279 RepID=UPI00177D1703|nr:MULTISPECIES: MmgE/PrpD family protein [unclassified Massilia]MBD8532949.1 MmgE/PrpD family protein [Massilia sp. CFBP 13647]MBD8676288.1 MmgE/PrpD family protein [Massilia sp. CFBP 13721]
METSRRKFVQLSALMASSWAVPAFAFQGGPAPGAVPDAIYALVDFCLDTRYEALPAEVVAVTRTQILDTVAVALPALGADGIRQLAAWSRDTGGKAESLVLGTKLRLPAEKAARLNAAMAAALEYDDTYEPSLLHASCVTVPVALAMADFVGRVSGKELIAAVAVGTDAACRLSRAGSPGVSPFIVGWDPTPMYGFLAATLVAGRLMGLNRAQLVSAVGLAYHQLSGNAQASVDGTHAKRLGAGFAAYGGIMSARLAKHGVIGSDRVLGGVKGLFRQYHGGKYSEEALLGGLGTRFAGVDIAPKPYPSCRGGHVAIDGILELVKANDIRAADVDTVTIYSPPAEMMLLGAPLEKKQNPQTVVEAQFSNPWMVAAAIQDREVGLRHFTDAALRRADLRALAKRMVTVEDKSLVRPDGGPGFVRLELKTRDGRRLGKEVRFAKGDPKNPMTAEEYRKKVFECTDAAGMKRAQANAVVARLQKLEAEADVAALNAALAIG